MQSHGLDGSKNSFYCPDNFDKNQKSSRSHFAGQPNGFLKASHLSAVDKIVRNLKKANMRVLQLYKIVPDLLFFYQGWIRCWCLGRSLCNTCQLLFVNFSLTSSSSQVCCLFLFCCDLQEISRPIEPIEHVFDIYTVFQFSRELCPPWDRSE